MKRSKIEWCDRTWNPITGCNHISPGCDNCYAEVMSKRFGWTWGKPVFHSDRLGRPAKTKTPSRVFICSMSDLGQHGVTADWLRQIVDAMAAAPQHQYIVLTKRPGEWIQALPLDVWVGVSIENAAMMYRWQRLKQIAGDRLKFISFEPLLEPISLAYELFNGGDSFGYLPDLGWVIAGPATGPSARKCKDEWIYNMRNDCEFAGVPFFDKSKENWAKREWPKGKEMWR